MNSLGKPIIEIYRDERRKFTVLVDGQAIPNLKSFSIAVTNVTHNGVQEAPSYHVEQYLPRKNTTD